MTITKAVEVYSNICCDGGSGGGGGGTITGGLNLGTGDGVFAGVVGTDLTFKSLKAGTGITLTPSGTEILIDASGASGSEWLLAGNTGAGNKLGTTDANSFQLITSNSPLVTFDASGSGLWTKPNTFTAAFNVNDGTGSNLTISTNGYIEIASGVVGGPALNPGDAVLEAQGTAYLYGIAGAEITAQNGSIQIDATNGNVDITALGATSTALLRSSQDVTVESISANVDILALSGEIVIDSPVLKLNNLPVATGTHVLTYTPGLGLNTVSYSSAPALTNAWLLGGNALVAPQTLSSTGDITFQSTAGTINIVATNPGEIVAVQGDTVELAGNIVDIEAATGTLDITALADKVNITALDNITILATGASKIVTLNASGAGSGVVLSANAFTNLTAPLVQFPNTATTLNANVNVMSLQSANNATFTSTAGTTAIAGFSGLILDSTNVTLPNIPNISTPNVLYYNTATNLVSYSASPYIEMPWTIVTGTSQALVAGNGYVAAGVSLQTFTLPVTASVGSRFRIACTAAGLFRVAQNNLQKIRLGTSVSTVGVTGYVEATAIGDCVELVCTKVDSDFTIVSSVGSFNVI